MWQQNPMMMQHHHQWRVDSPITPSQWSQGRMQAGQHSSHTDRRSTKQPYW